MTNGQAFTPTDLLMQGIARELERIRQVIDNDPSLRYLALVVRYDRHGHPTTIESRMERRWPKPPQRAVELERR